jgi:hypothetical protein
MILGIFLEINRCHLEEVFVAAEGSPPLRGKTPFGPAQGGPRFTQNNIELR